MIVTLINGHVIAKLIQSPCAGQSCRTASDDCNLDSVAMQRNPAFLDPTVRISRFNDIAFVVSDCNALAVQSFITSNFARRRTNESGKFRKRICQSQSFKSMLVFFTIDQIVPLRNQIIIRAAADCAPTGIKLTGMTVRNAAIHTACCLFSAFFDWKNVFHFFKIFDTFSNRSNRIVDTRIFHKTKWICHNSILLFYLDAVIISKAFCSSWSLGVPFLAHSAMISLIWRYSLG